MAHTACLVCLFSTVGGRCKQTENALEDVALVAGTQQNLSNSLDIYETHLSLSVFSIDISLTKLISGMHWLSYCEY